MTRPPLPAPSSRRRFLAGTAAAAAACFRLSAAGAPRTLRYAGLTTDAYLGPVETAVVVRDRQVFTEGPAVDRAGDVYFTNIPVSKILIWSPRTGRLTVFREDSNETNGLCFAPNGDLLCCEGAARRVTRIDIRTGRRRVLADAYQGRPLAKPNDLCLDRRGRIYFTSRTAVRDPEGENPKAVYRIDPDGSLERLLVWPETQMPNGIALSPDERRLYLIEAHPDGGHWRRLRVFDLDDSGRLSNGRVLVDFYPGRSGDGMCVDAEGRLYVAAGLHQRRGTSETLDTRPGVHVLSPEGELLAWRETPGDLLTNCTLGGEDGRWLYVTCGDRLLRLRTTAPGARAIGRPPGGG